MESARLRVAVDIGGTFTDVVGVRGGELRTAKVLSTPSDLTSAVMAGLRVVLDAFDANAADVTVVVHATTIATNALLERKGARVGLIVTQGFRDILEIGRQRRPDPYDLDAQKLAPLVDRSLVRDVPGRIDASGQVLHELDEDAVAAAGRQLIQAEAETLAISFLHSYANSIHEERAAAILQGLAATGLPIFASHRILPLFREYERTSTTVIAAYLAPTVAVYLQTLSHRLGAIGAPSRFWVMKSNGGLVTSDVAASHPEQLVESGPAAGVVAVLQASKKLGVQNLISFDMGGTTAKASLISGSALIVNLEYEVGGSAHAGGFLRKGTGYPLRVPVVDLAEVGTGGGSIAWVDQGGALRIGPRSAGAEPGPACYGRGGSQATVTDADLVLGYLTPGDKGAHIGRLDLERARKAIKSEVANHLSISVEEAARGIFDLANAQMAGAVRLVSIARGHDPRTFALVGFGGAGPIHAWSIAQDLSIRQVLIPPLPGLNSAVGLLEADFRLDVSRGLHLVLGSRNAGREMNRVFAALTEEAGLGLAEQGHATTNMSFSNAADMRYVGQSYEINVPVSCEPGSPLDVSRISDTFHAIHEQSYGYCSPHDPVEVLALRVTGIVQAQQLSASWLPYTALRYQGQRTVHFGATAYSCPVIDRADVVRQKLEGPVIVQQADTTTVVPPGASISSSEAGFLVLEL